MEEIFHEPAKREWQAQLLRSGVISAKEFSELAELRAFLPHPDLRSRISHYWVLRWNLPDGVAYKPYEVLGDPVVTILVSRQGAFVYGIVPTKLEYEARGRDVIAGVTFLPAGFHPYWKRPMHALPAGKLDLVDVLPEAASRLGNAMLDYPDDAEIGAVFDDYFRSVRVESGLHIKAIHEILLGIAADPETRSLASISRRFRLPERTLQHIFRQEVGINLKWVIKRIQVLEAVQDAFTRESPDWSAIAQDYDYTSQSHFISDFKRVFGMSPERFHRSLGLSGPAR